MGENICKASFFSSVKFPFPYKNIWWDKKWKGKQQFSLSFADFSSWLSTYLGFYVLLWLHKFFIISKKKNFIEPVRQNFEQMLKVYKQNGKKILIILVSEHKMLSFLKFEWILWNYLGRYNFVGRIFAR